MKTEMKELNNIELSEISGGDYGSSLATAGLAVAAVGIGVAVAPVVVAAAAGYGVALVVVGMAAFVEGAWFSFTD